MVAESFEAVVNQPGRDALVLFYSPSCPHCKKLEPVYRELAGKVPSSAAVLLSGAGGTLHLCCRTLLASWRPTPAWWW